MSRNPNPSPATIGLRVKSGWATAVLLTGPAASPSVLDRRRVELSDPAVPRSRQPYHAGFGTAQSDTRAIARLIELVERHVHRSLAQLVRDYRAMGSPLRGAALVVGSDIDPEAIANPHIRAHASEGRLFRTVTEDALRQLDVLTSVFLEQHLYDTAVQRLGRSQPEIRRAVAELPRRARAPWRAEEKAAALAAWLALLDPSRRPTAQRS